jgi:glycosyltransferase involved in cell wall biosynthesis
MEPAFALCFEGRLSEELRESGAPVHTLGAVRASRPLSVRRAREVLARLLRTGAYDLVVCHSAWTQALLGPVVRDARIPLVFWLHDVITGKHWLERWARRTPPALVIANSMFTTAAAQRLYPFVSAKVIYCPVSVTCVRLSKAEREDIRAKLNTSADTTVIIQSSRMEEWKGHDLHLQALSLLKGVPGWICWMIGGGQRPAEVRYLERLKRSAAQLEIADRVRFTGERADARRLLAAADIHCQPNTRPEPFGIAFVEAMLAGLPIVTTASGGAKEVVDESCGLLVEEGDVRGLAEALHALLVNPERRAQLGAHGPSRASQLCDPSTQINRLNVLLCAVASHQVAA